jgi:DNA-directed RNA polymerase subunit RPC12/RpoP
MQPLAPDVLPIVDAEIAAPAGGLCPSCGAPIEALDPFCSACRTDNPYYQQRPDAAAPRPARTDAPPALPQQRHFRCQQCGAEVATDPEQRSYVCPFCDSSYVVEFSPDTAGRQPPEFVIGFTITPDDALAAFRRWLRQNAWFRPGDLHRASVTDKLKGVYLPFWSFTMLAQSRWRATIGEYWYRTETYTERDSKGNLVTRTRQVREIEWWPLAGRHHQYYSGYLVSGSRGLPQDQALRILPFQLPALKRYQPYFLAGWLAEEYSVDREDALARCEGEFLARERHNVAAFLPGDTHRDLTVDTQFSHNSSDLCLLPIYILSYRYRGQLYRFLLNGQTGKMDGDKPVSRTRIAVAVAIGLAVLLLVLLLAALARRP